LSAYYIDDDFVKAEGSSRIIARISPNASAAEQNEFETFCIEDRKEVVSTLKVDILRDLNKAGLSTGGLFSVNDIEEILDNLKVT
jgi:hypothetical protein